MLKNTEWVYNKDVDLYSLTTNTILGVRVLAGFYKLKTGVYWAFAIQADYMEKTYNSSSVEQIKEDLEKEVLKALKIEVSRYKTLFKHYLSIAQTH